MKILVIDDDDATTDLLKILLKPISADVLVANSGVEGIHLVKNAAPDLVLLDLMMPGMNGWDVCKALRQFSGIPILIISALDIPDVVAQALNAGADDYLVKPLTLAILSVRIQKLTRRRMPNLRNSIQTS